METGEAGTVVLGVLYMLSVGLCPPPFPGALGAGLERKQTIPAEARWGWGWGRREKPEV